MPRLRRDVHGDDQLPERARRRLLGWIDQCEAEDEERAKRDAARDRGEDVEEDAPAPKRTRIDFADPAEDEAEVDPNDDPALHAGL